MSSVEHAPPRSRRRSAPRLLLLLLLAGLITVAVRMLVVQSFVVPTGSMAPTVEPGERVLVSRLGHWFGSVHRGDVVVFDGSGIFTTAAPPARNSLAQLGRSVAGALGAPVGHEDFVKRVIGVGGDRVTCCDAQGRITVNGVAIAESYLPAGTTPSRMKFDVVVPTGKLWLMGDHRDDSADSRAHLGDPGGGMVPVDRVVGRVVAVWWPLGDMRGVH